jgi:simple sugar transport system substrate-binding protein
MRKILIAATAAMLAIGASLFGASAADKLKVGFIYIGPIGDLGWTYQHDLARQALVKELGEKIETLYRKCQRGSDADRSNKCARRTS